MRDRKRIGTVLSGSTSERLSFLVLEGAEDEVRVGKYVVTIPPSGAYRYIAMIEDLEYYHEFYEEGDVWVEAIRKGMSIPERVARQYLRARARIVGVVTGSGLEQSHRPPPPGSPVYTVKGEDLKPVYGHDPSDTLLPPHLIDIGILYGYHKEGLRAFLDLRALTMHMAIIGTTGSGKSNTMAVIIEELGRKHEIDVGISVAGGRARTVPILIVDANAVYTDYYEDPDLVPSYTEVHRIVFEDSVAYKHRHDVPPKIRSRIFPLRLDLNVLGAGELAEAILMFQKGDIGANMLQLDYLSRILSEDELEKRKLPVDYNLVLGNDSYKKRLLNSIEKDAQSKEGYVHSATARAVQRAIETFTSELKQHHLFLGEDDSKTQPVTSDYIDILTDPKSPKLAILDFSVEGATGVSLRLKQFVMYVVAMALYKRFVDFYSEKENRVMIFAIEEAQNFAPNLVVYNVGYSLARNVLQLVATQGRKFGLSLALITQRPKFVDPTVFSMANTFIIHRVSPVDVKFVEDASGGVPSAMRRRLTVMERGTAIVVGQMNPSPTPTIALVKKSKLKKRREDK